MGVSFICLMKKHAVIIILVYEPVERWYKVSCEKCCSVTKEYITINGTPHYFDEITGALRW